jgi:hypothetical protein
VILLAAPAQAGSHRALGDGNHGAGEVPAIDVKLPGARLRTTDHGPGAGAARGARVPARAPAARVPSGHQTVEHRAAPVGRGPGGLRRRRSGRAGGPGRLDRQRNVRLHGAGTAAGAGVSGERPVLPGRNLVARPDWTRADRVLVRGGRIGLPAEIDVRPALRRTVDALLAPAPRDRPATARAARRLLLLGEGESRALAPAGESRPAPRMARSEARPRLIDVGSPPRDPHGSLADVYANLMDTLDGRRPPGGRGAWSAIGLGSLYAAMGLLSLGIVPIILGVSRLGRRRSLSPLFRDGLATTGRILKVDSASTEVTYEYDVGEHRYRQSLTCAAPPHPMLGRRRSGHRAVRAGRSAAQLRGLSLAGGVTAAEINNESTPHRRPSPRTRPPLSGDLVASRRHLLQADPEREVRIGAVRRW